MRIALLLTISAVMAAAGFAQTAAVPPAAPVASSANWPTAQFAATAAKDPGVAKAKKILDDMIRALGGEAYLTMRDMTVEGRSYAFYEGRPKGLGVLFWRFWQAPDKDRYELTKQRDVIDLYVGDQGYETTYKGTVAIEPKLLSEYLRRRQHSLEWVIRNWLSAPGSIILYDGTAIVEQNLADRVTILNASNDSVTIAVDPRTHLPVRKSYSFRDPLDRQFDEDAEIYSNYKTVQGIATPYSTVRMENGDMTNQRFVNKVSYDIGLPPSLFEPNGLLYKNAKPDASKPQ
jgi:hypothetical protein